MTTAVVTVAFYHAWWILWFFGLVLVGFAVPEYFSIKRHQGGVTFTSNVRLWLRTDTHGGGVSWLLVWSTMACIWIWFLGHILRWWP